MNIHEYQAKELLAKFGVPVPGGVAALSVDEAVAAVDQLPGPLYVVKAQIHAGGRGKGKFKELGPDAKGGVRLARSADEVRAAAQDMLGNTLVTIQTGPEGKQVNRLYVTDGVDIAKEFYLALLVDRATGRVSFVVSTEGGMNIEDVAHDTPEKIQTFSVDPAPGLQPHHGRAVAAALGLSGDLAKQAQNVAAKLYDAFLGTDAEQIEINPLAITDDNKLLVLDAKVGFDGNAMFRHKDLMELRDESEEDPMELEASKYDLAYIKLDGNIGCMVNGRGPGHGDDGHHQAERRLPGQLPRRRRRRFEGEGHGRLQDHPRRPGGEGHPGQHLRRHHEVRHHRRRHHCRRA
jgi:succinyl-CoA synthetase beta subunit